MAVLKEKSMWTVFDNLDFLTSFISDNEDKIKAVDRVLERLIKEAKEHNNDERYISLLNEIKYIMQHRPAEERKEYLLDILNRYDIDYISICDSDTDFIYYVLDECKGNYFFYYDRYDDVFYIYELE